MPKLLRARAPQDSAGTEHYKPRSKLFTKWPDSYHVAGVNLPTLA